MKYTAIVVFLGLLYCCTTISCKIPHPGTSKRAKHAVISSLSQLRGWIRAISRQRIDKCRRPLRWQTVVSSRTRKCISTKRNSRLLIWERRKPISCHSFFDFHWADGRRKQEKNIARISLAHGTQDISQLKLVHKTTHTTHSAHNANRYRNYCVKGRRLTNEKVKPYPTRTPYSLVEIPVASAMLTKYFWRRRESKERALPHVKALRLQRERDKRYNCRRVARVRGSCAGSLFAVAPGSLAQVVPRIPLRS